MLKYNPDTKIIFDNDEAAVAPIVEITRDQIPDLIANGASVDASANVGEQTSSPAATDGVAPAAQDPVASVTDSATGVDAGNTSAAAGVSATAPAATLSADSAQSESTSLDDSGKADTPETSASASADVSPAVISDALADPGGAGSADLNPTPAAPNLDAQGATSGASSDAVPLAAGGAAGGAADASTADVDTEEEHPLTIIEEIEQLVVIIGNAAVHEYQRLIQRLADLKNHPKIKDE